MPTESIDQLDATRQLVEQERKLLEEQRLALERTAIESESAQLRMDRMAIEDTLVNFQRFVDPFEHLPTEFGFRRNFRTSRAPYLSTLNDTTDGKYVPFINDEQDIANARALARVVTTTNCPGIGIVENLQNYIIGPGYKFTASAKNKRPAPPGLVTAVQDVVDEFLDDNDFIGDLDRELLLRAARDGEYLVGLYPRPGGKTLIRMMEPEQLMEPGTPWNDQDLFERWGINPNISKSCTFGVHTAEHDVQTVFGYSIAWATGDYDYLPACHAEHYKVNVGRNVKRGLSDFYSAWKWLQLEERLLENTGEGAATLSAIAYIVQHMAQVTKQRVESMREGAADVRYDVRTAGGGTKTYMREYHPPGSKLDVPKGQEYHAGPAGHERGNAFLEVVQGILRQVATRWGMSEGMVSGDDSNNNLACHDDRTEVLSENGWITYDKIRYDTKIATQNPVSGQLEFQFPRAIHIYRHAGPMVRFKGAHQLDAMVTQNHRMWVTKKVHCRVGGKMQLTKELHPFRFVQAGDLIGKASRYYMHFSAKPMPGEIPDEFIIPDRRRKNLKLTQEHVTEIRALGGILSEAKTASKFGVSRVTVHDIRSGKSWRSVHTARRIDVRIWLEFLGYWLAEGWTVNSGASYPIGLAQNDGRDACRMRELIDIMGFKSVNEATRYPDDVGNKVIRDCVTRATEVHRQFTWMDRSLWIWLRENCGTDSHSKRIPSEIKKYDPSLLNILLDAMIAGDGRDGLPAGTRKYFTASKQLADDVQEIGIRCGFVATIETRTQNDAPFYTVTLKVTDFRPRGFNPRDNCTIAEYVGPVWCCTVDNGLILTRRNGKPAITGNSSITSGSRFHRYAICRQAAMGTRFKRIVWKAIRNAYTAGRFEQFGYHKRYGTPDKIGLDYGPGSYKELESLIEVIADPPDVDELGKLEQEQIRDMRLKNGIMSEKTYRGEVGLNEDVELQNLADQRARNPQPMLPGMPGQPGQPPGLPAPGAPQQLPVSDQSSQQQLAKMVAGAVTEVLASHIIPNQVFEASGYGGNGKAKVKPKVGYLMAPLSGESAKAVLDLTGSIDADELVGDGIEKEPHITVKWGLLTDDAQEVFDVVRGMAPFYARIGDVGTFQSDEHDVLKIAIDSPDLHLMHERICRALPYVESHPEYHPHATLAYVAPGGGQVYSGPCSLTGKSILIDRLVYVAPDKTRMVLPLNGHAPTPTIEMAEVLERCRRVVESQADEYAGTLADSQIAECGGDCPKDKAMCRKCRGRAIEEFKSEAQRRWMWANDPVMARKWAHEAFCPTGEGGGIDNSCSPVAGASDATGFTATMPSHGGYMKKFIVGGDSEPQHVRKVHVTADDDRQMKLTTVGQMIKDAGPRLPKLKDIEALVGKEVSIPEAAAILTAAGGDKDESLFLADGISKDERVKVGSLIISARHEWQEQAREERGQKAVKSAGEFPVVMFHKPGSDRKFIVHPSTRPHFKKDDLAGGVKPVKKWQLTGMDEKGPWGHSEYDTRDEAIFSAVGAHPKGLYYNDGDEDFVFHSGMGTATESYESWDDVRKVLESAGAIMPGNIPNATPNLPTIRKRRDVIEAADADCGANAPGGDGFQPGNTCAKDDGSEGKEWDFPSSREEVAKTESKITEPKNDEEWETFAANVKAHPYYQEVSSRLTTLAKEVEGRPKNDHRKDYDAGDVRFLSIEKNTDAQGNYTDERKELHEKIITETLNPKAVAKEGQKPKAVLLIGPPGAGKSTAGQPIAEKLADAFTLINADNVKAKLPEYEGWNAATLHEESSEIAEHDLKNRAMAARHNIIFDITGNNGKKMETMAKELVAKGYEVHAVTVTIPTYKSSFRAWKRFAGNAFSLEDPTGEPGRFVPVDYVHVSVNWNPSKTYDKLKESGLVESWAKLDNNVPFGTPAKVLDKGIKSTNASKAIESAISIRHAIELMSEAYP